MIIRSFRIAVLAMVASLVAVAAVAAESIKIGFNVPQTGFAAADGNSALTGAQLAVEQVNAAGGVLGRQLELVVYDDQASPKESAPIATRLTTLDKVVAGVSGSYSGATRAAAAVFQAAGIPYISAYAVHPDITRSGDYVYRTSFVGVVQGRAGAKLVGEVLGLKRVVIVTLQNDFGQSLTAGFKEMADKYGIEIVGEYEYSIKDRQFGPIVSSIKADAPDAIYASGYFFTAGPMVSQLRAGGVDATVIGQEGYDSQKFIEIAGAASEGVIITTSLDRDSSNEVTQNFIKAFEAKAGFKADMVAASGHTAILVLAAAIEKAGSTDADAIRDALKSVSVDAATGTISFNSLGEVMKDVQIQIVRDGNWHHHSVISDAEVTAPPTE
ncbi:MAG: ABC transporter substrate-binding protein [Fimbriimonadaceae bacterium]|nr:ABC transporter substrate-binding protein [Alphaproteobacteria bacterium]